MDTLKVKFICPFCKKENEYNVYKSINIKDNLSLKEDVLNLNIFKFKCDCNNTYNMYYPLTYIDDDKKILISFNKEVLEYKDYSIRYVTKPYKLTEKILIIDNNLDDRIIEILKEFILASTNESYDLLFALDKDKSLKFILLDDNFKALKVIDFNKSMYDYIYEKFISKVLNIKDILIDKQWARKFLMEVK